MIYAAILGAAVFAALVVLAVLRFRSAGQNFEQQKRTMKPRCSEETVTAFMEFLRHYEGGYVRRRNGRFVRREYLNKEKGDLKGIFFNIIVPNSNLHSYQKEEFRKLLISLGVTGISERPDYETRAAALRNRETDPDAHARKEAGNEGERIIRQVLQELQERQYAVIHGAKLRFGENVREYDHIAVGMRGVFIIETKAFGMSGGRPVKAGLFINSGDSWILRKNHENRPLTSPTEQIMSAALHLRQILADLPVPVYPILALSNTELFVTQNITLPYAVVRADQLIDSVNSVNDHLTETDIYTIVHAIDESRVN